jgi:hypothetical protein
MSTLPAYITLTNYSIEIDVDRTGQIAPLDYTTPLTRLSTLTLLPHALIKWDAENPFDVVLVDGLRSVIIGQCQWVTSPEYCNVMITTWELHFNMSPSLSFMIDGQPAIALDGDDYGLLPYCTAVIHGEDYTWSVSQNGICSNNATCNTTLGVCQCGPVTSPPVAPGDICDGNPPLLDCSLPCPFGQAPTPKCDQCTCTNGFTCPDNKQASQDCSVCLDKSITSSGSCTLLCENGTSPNVPDDTCTHCDCTGTEFSGSFCENCGLTCLHGGSPQASCIECDCPLLSFFVGKQCETCQLQCLNQGMANPSCTTCQCSRAGYSGDRCECRFIKFSLTFLAVPPALLEAFTADPVGTGSSQTALGYIRNALLSQSEAKQDKALFDKLIITSIELIEPARPELNNETSLRIYGNIADNCAETFEMANYDELKNKWSKFLEFLSRHGIKIDDENIPVVDVELQLPDIQCDEVLDPDCDGVYAINTGIGRYMNPVGFISLIVGILFMHV